ncbi:DEAD-box ATP-dependent RNA helicase 38-like [Bidens hawaiensis]|uniref:DEAD-box ATP-dependent RNA helicase 38-like n=1 Tax=Bidens hawaiensis TaxID=980011 RepID=UPI00404A1159
MDKDSRVEDGGSKSAASIHDISISTKKFLDLLKESEALLPSTYSSHESEKEVNVFFDEDSDIQVRFEDLNISPELMKGLCVDMKFVRPTKIQSMSFPMILTPPYKNVMVQAPRVSEKTTCSVLAMLNSVDPTLPAPQALCLCPTRGHATEAMEVVLNMGQFTRITSDLVLPGDISSKSYCNHIPVSKRAPATAQVIISSPGTAYQMIALHKLRTSNLKIIVFEVADLMMRAYKDAAVRIMEEIVRWSPKCQVLLFSTTFSDRVKPFVSTLEKDLFVQEFHQLSINKEELSLGSFKQYKVNVDDDVSKLMVIRDKILKIGDGVWQTIIYVKASDKAQILHEALVKCGYAVTTLNKAITGKVQDRIFKEFKDGSNRILISADFLFSGFDQSRVNLVVNYDIPVKRCEYPPEPDYQVYLSHVGRAGRYGRKGAVFNLLCDDKDSMMMEKIERQFKHNVTEGPSWTSDDDFKVALKKAGLL